MAGDVSLELKDPTVLKALATIPRRLYREIRVGLLRYMRTYVSPGGSWQRRFMRGRHAGPSEEGGGAAGGLRRRTGALARSFQAVDVTGAANLGSIAVRAFTTSPYAAIHEFGGTIKAKRQRKVFVTRESVKYGQRTFAYDRTMLTWRSGTGSRARWFSKREVKIPARMRFLASFVEDTKARDEMLQNAAARALAPKPTGGAGEAAPAEGAA